ncbi:MAG: hypothetical protein AAGA22_01120 [Pseudomonadota bacterium]
MKIGLIWATGVGPKSPKNQRRDLAEYDVHPLSLDDDRPLEKRRAAEGDEFYAIHIKAVATDPASLVRGFVNVVLGGAKLFVEETGKWYKDWPDVAELATDYQRLIRKEQTAPASEAKRGWKKKRPKFWPDDAAVKQARAEWRNPKVSIQRMADDYGTDRRTLVKWAKHYKFGPKPEWER